MWHTHKYAKAPEVEIRHSLKSSRDFNQTPTAANYRDERVGRNESRRRAARDQDTYEQKTLLTLDGISSLT